MHHGNLRPGDRVVAIHTDLSGPICGPDDPALHPFSFPDGPLQKGAIYHAASVQRSRDGNQGLTLTGLRILWGSNQLPWNSTRFRKVEKQIPNRSINTRRKLPELV